jgi:CRP/FNR family cyclic AMP-dependent transcriptional regulator
MRLEEGGQGLSHDLRRCTVANESRLTLLDALDPAERAQLLARSVPRHLAPGTILSLAGGDGRRVHIVENGVVKLTARDAEGRETILALAVRGDVLGDLAAIDNRPQPVDSIAATPCDLLGIDSKALGDVLASNPAAAFAMTRSLASRLRWVCGTALERTSVSVPARLAGRLLELADLVGRADDGAVEIEVPLGQADLGRLAGMCRESACKALRQFRANGLIDYRRRRLRILDPDALEAIRTGIPPGL